MATEVNHTGLREDRFRIMQNYLTIMSAESAPEWSLSQARMYEKLVTEAYETLCEHHRALLTNEMEGRAVKGHAEYGQKGEKMYMELLVRVQDRLAGLQPAEQGAGGDRHEPHVIRVEQRKDPRVGTFDGTSQAWLGFRDLFTAEVINRDDIAAINKLRYLQEACVDKAADALGPWERCDQNFEPAWKMLQDRYDDEFPIRQGLVKKIFALPQIKEETFDGLSRAINVVQGVLRQLNAMNVATDQWDPIIIHLLTHKLPPITMDTWEQRRAAGQIPTLKQLLEFIQGRGREEATRGN